MKDRQNEFVDNNRTLCEENCIIDKYDPISKKVICSCKIKVELPPVKDIQFDKNKLFNNFKNIKQLINFNIVKCIHSVFNKENIKFNFGLYTVIPVKFLLILCILYFYIVEYKNIENEINDIIKAKIY